MFKEYKDYSWKILPVLLKSEGVASNCSKTASLVAEYLTKEDAPYKFTNKGGVIVTLRGKNSTKSRLFTAHIDTLGGMVKSISQNGRINLVPIGGASAISIEGEYVTIETSSGKRFRGTALHNNPSAHVNKDISTEKRTYDNISIRIDEVVKNDTDVKRLGINIGDYIFFDPRVEVSNSGFIKSRHLDDKAGAAVLLGAVKYFKKKSGLAYDTIFYFSVGEEVGNGTVSKIPENCFEIIAVDMGALGRNQASDEFSVSICAKDSTGPFDYDLRKRITATADKYKIPYRVDIYPHYGSDAAAALRTGVDAKHMLFGPGIDASHSYERVHRDSVDATLELIIRFASEP